MRERGKVLLIATGLLAGCGDARKPAAGAGSCSGINSDAIVWVPGGTFVRGEHPAYPEEAPSARGCVEGFWMDAHEVTNAQFAAFVAARGYVTVAERAPVDCFAANAFGLHDMIGNVWYGRDRVIKGGGSFLCAANHYARYRPASRQFQERGMGTDHIGYRLIDTSRPRPEVDRATR
jgi:formylglycine-generating enzyme required for sulfatase activity